MNEWSIDKTWSFERTKRIIKTWKVDILYSVWMIRATRLEELQAASPAL